MKRSAVWALRPETADRNIPCNSQFDFGFAISTNFNARSFSSFSLPKTVRYVNAWKAEGVTPEMITDSRFDTRCPRRAIFWSSYMDSPDTEGTEKTRFFLICPGQCYRGKSKSSALQVSDTVKIAPLPLWSMGLLSGRSLSRYTSTGIFDRPDKRKRNLRDLCVSVVKADNFLFRLEISRPGHQGQ